MARAKKDNAAIACGRGTGGNAEPGTEPVRKHVRDAQPVRTEGPGVGPADASMHPERDAPRGNAANTTDTAGSAPAGRYRRNIAMRAIASTDHLGNEYPSTGAMLDAYGVNRATFMSRLAAGKSLEEALRPAKDTSCRDHTGKEFPSQNAMARAWGIEPHVLRGRLRNGQSLKDALETPVEKEAVKDHTGREFPDMANMARAWGVDPAMLKRRLDKNWTLKDALETPPRQLPGGRVKDHTGRGFVNTQEMLDAWGIKKSVYKKRIKNGMAMREALETPVPDAIRAVPCRDHDGKEFKSISAMCQHYGISRDVYADRIGKGWTQEDALCTPVKEKTAIRDWNGRLYDSISELADAIRVSRNFISYKWMQCTGAENAAARACILHWPGMDAGRYRIRECVAFPWFLCEDLDNGSDAPHAGEFLFHADQILALISADGQEAAS